MYDMLCYPGSDTQNMKRKHTIRAQPWQLHLVITYGPKHILLTVDTEREGRTLLGHS